MASDTFSPDFYNDLAAVCVVVLFAKFMTHRGHPRTSRWLWTLHALCLISSAGGVFIPLLAVYQQSSWYLLRDLSWACLAFSSLILIGVGLYEDFPKRRNGAQRTPGSAR